MAGVRLGLRLKPCSPALSDFLEMTSTVRLVCLCLPRLATLSTVDTTVDVAWSDDSVASGMKRAFVDDGEALFVLEVEEEGGSLTKS